MNKIKVLVFPSGEINSIELHTALSSCVNIELFGGASVDRHGPYVYQNYIGSLPFIFENNFIDELNIVIKKYSLDLIIPSHDTVALFFAQNNKSIATKVLTPNINTAKICRNKKETYKLFEDCDFTPKIFKPGENVNFPVFIKPNVGEGGKGAKKIYTKEELLSINDLDKFVCCEYLPGNEVTVDCFTDKDRNLKGVFPRTRQRVFCGVSVEGESIETNSEIFEIANTINSRLEFLGMWFFQLKSDINKKYKLLEISARCSGGMCLTRARGANLPLLSVYAAMGHDIEVMYNDYSIKMDRTLINRYKTNLQYNTVYLDFDDTLVVKNKINLDVMRFVYQCKNKDVKVVLLTKHEGNIIETLGKYCIDKNLFSEIKVLQPQEEKYKFVTQINKAIFIDNAYIERKLVRINTNIPVFDVDSIEVLLDWRK